MLFPHDLVHLRVTIVGVGREGRALARFLTSLGARVTLSDTKSAGDLQEELAALEGIDLNLALGGEPPDLDVDVLFVSPGVPPSAPVVQRARERGVPISSEPRLFTQLCRAPVVGITGSNGKTTTTALVGEMFQVAGKKTWVGGNIGFPLTNCLLEGDAPQVAVMELSSFQLELFSPDYQGKGVEDRRSEASRVVSLKGWSPHVAAITNITPNHLDRHPSMADYVRAKSFILAFQGRDDWAILNADDAYCEDMAATSMAQLIRFSLEGPVARGAFLQGDRLLLRWEGREKMICRTSQVRLRGRHNLANILAAACCAVVGGVDVASMRRVAGHFAGVPHRLEKVRRWRGVLFVNDSIATTPERAMAALRSFEEPQILLAGGRDKHLPWDRWADLVLDRVKYVIAFGEARPVVCEALAEARQRRALQGDIPRVYKRDSLNEAVPLAAELAEAGDVVLLSPGGASFDAFEDFEARGEAFRDLVATL
ncbi:MAG: UDP-N-acetylmuramoyl-L-alanine--D-glutamate ligase [Anaerolineales bacterium]